MQFTNGNTTNYVYNAAGQKLSVTYQTAVAGVVIPMTNVMTPLSPAQILQTFKTDYCGNVVYENGTVSRILTEEGYITFTGTTPVYHYYLKDHQGNNRVVLNQNGTVEQVNHYYPFGGLFGESTAGGVQPYKYNGKELDRMHGLDLFDYGARHYDAAIGRWWGVDMLAEKNYAESSYSYVHNSPVIHVDPDGKDGVVIISGNNITIKSNIILTGNLATTTLAKIYKQDIMDNWGLVKSYTDGNTKYNITWDINVRVALPNEKRIFDGINNYLEVKPNIQSYVENSNTGEIRSTDLLFSNPASHEFGHILGLKDKYITNKTDPNYPNPISKDWKYNIMAAPAGLGVVEDKNIKQILDKPLKWNETWNSLKTKEFQNNSVFKNEMFDFLKDIRYWINNKNKEQ